MTSLRESIAPVAALLFSVAMLLMGNGLQGTLLPVRANLETFSNVQIGVLGSFYYIGFTLGCLAGPALIARAGHIRAYLALVSVASTVALVHAMVIEPMLWWLLRAITGFCFSVLYVIIESWLNERSDNGTRGTIFSVYTIINLTVITVGQMMLVLGDPQAFPLFALASILVSLAGVPVAMTRSKSPEVVPVVMPRLLRLYRLSPVGIVGCFSVGLSVGAFWSLGPIYAMDGGMNALGIALFMSAVALGGAVGQWPLGIVSDIVDRRMVILVTCVTAALAGVALSRFQPAPLDLTLAMGFLYGVFSFPLYAISVAHANDHSHPADYVETASGLLLIFGVGSIIGPIVAVLVDSFIAHRSLFLYTAAIYALTAFFVLWRVTQRAAVPADEKVDFRDALVSAETASAFEVPTPEHDR